MTWVTRARVIPSCRAMSAWVPTSPEASKAFHSWAFLSSSTTRGVRDALGGFGQWRTVPSIGAPGAQTTLFSKVLGPRAISMIC